MNQVQFAQEMTQRGCVTDGSGNYCGTYNGYPFTVVYRGGKENGRTDFMLSLVLGGNVKSVKMFKEVRRKLKTSAPGIIKIYNGDTSTNATWYMYGAVGAAVAAASEAVISGNVFSVSIKRSEDFAAGFEALMASTVQTSIEMGYGVPDTCPVCKGSGCDSYAFYENGYRPVHDACVREKAVTVAAKHDENQRSGSYLLGFVGALLGAAVGTIPNLLLILFLDMIAGLACMLIPVGAYYGYKLFRGKRTKLATLFVVLASILVVPVQDYALEWFIANSNGMALSVRAYIYYFTVNTEAFIIDWAIQLFFVLIGIAIAWGIIKKDGGAEVKSAAFSVDTLRPMGHVAAPAMAAPAAVQPAVAVPDASAAPAPSMQSAAATQAEKDLEA